MPVLWAVPRFDDKLYSFLTKVVEKSSKIMFFLKSDINQQKKKPPAGMLATEVRAGDAPKPPFPTKPIENQQTSQNQPPVNHKIYPLFLSLFFVMI